ncbi:ATP-binding protein [Corynebacterium pacaense]|uniref:ATP-binding protein n=1 Tax=Corynebacterium pacaense TaxID=1816684 RepID=UPI0009BAC7BB|nr:ATP-binding protein [Corynebacterium pacaense]
MSEPSPNPFRPTFGASPRIWAGRRRILEDFEAALIAGPGDPTRSIVISGSRGIGKTVLLTELEDIAARRGWVIIRAPGRGGTISTLVNSTIPEKIRQLDPPQRRKLTGVRIAGIGGVETDFDDDDAPAPTLISRLRTLLSKLSGTGVLITLDEVQDASPDALSELAEAHQDLIRDDMEISFVVAGLTQGVDALLNLPGTTFLRRARRFELGPLTEEDSRATLGGTAAESGRPFQPSAVELAAAMAGGYPYLVQLVGALSWAAAAGEGAPAITDAHVESSRSEAVETMGRQVHLPSLKGVPPAQMNYLRAMADLSVAAREVSTSEIAEALGKSVHATTDTRSKLIDRELINPSGWGKVEFSLPYLAEFLRMEGRTTRVQ